MGLASCARAPETDVGQVRQARGHHVRHLHDLLAIAVALVLLLVVFVHGNVLNPGSILWQILTAPARIRGRGGRGEPPPDARGYPSCSRTNLSGRASASRSSPSFSRVSDLAIDRHRGSKRLCLRSFRKETPTTRQSGAEYESPPPNSRASRSTRLSRI